MFVTPAFAQGSPFGGDSMWMQLLPFVLIFVIMYFLILRPLEVEIADGVRVRQVRSMVSGVRTKGEPVKDEGGSS